MDKLFRIDTLRAMSCPQQNIWYAMHQCYGENSIAEELDNASLNHPMTEKKAGEAIVKHLLAGHRGHYGPLEHSAITVNVCNFPHSLMQQIRTHRVGVSFCVQSGRYTSKRIIDVANGDRKVEDVFYLRPVGSYSDRQGHKYFYTREERERDLEYCLQACYKYNAKMIGGHSEEHARGIIPFDIRQHFVLSCNARSLMHLLLIRGKKDAQLEAQQFCELLLEEFKKWCPEIAEWFVQNLWLKGRLAP